MSDNYRIITDTASELSLERCSALHINRLTLESNFGDIPWSDHDDLEGFFKTINSSNIPKTSGLNLGEFIDVATPILEAGQDIIYLGISSANSPSSENVRHTAQQMLQAQFENRRIVCLETLCICGGLEYLVTEAVKRQQMGFSLDELIDYVEGIKGNIAHHFTSEDLKYFLVGGRISRGEYIGGVLLRKKPVMRTDPITGKLISNGTANSTKAAVKAIGDAVINTIAQKDGRIIISYANCPDKAEYLTQYLCASGFSKDQIEISRIGVTIASHTGETAIAIFFEAIPG